MLYPSPRTRAVRRANLVDARSNGPLSKSSLDERRAFRSLYEQQHALVRRTVLRFRVSRDEVEDVVQEVFMILHLRLAELEDRASLEPWLCATARRVSSNWHRWYRRHRPASVYPILDADGFAAPGADGMAADERVARAELVERLVAAIDGLHPKRRTVLALRLFEELTMAQIAARLGTPLYTVASRLRTGYGELAHLLARSSHG